MFQDPSERSSPETSGPTRGRQTVSIGVGGPNSLQNMQKLKDFRSKYSAQEVCPPWEMECEVGDAHELDQPKNTEIPGLRRSLTIQDIKLKAHKGITADKMLVESTDIQPRKLHADPPAGNLLGKRSLECAESINTTQETNVRRVQSLNLDHFSTSALRHMSGQDQPSAPNPTKEAVNENAPVEHSPIKAHELTKAWQQGLLDGLQLSSQVLRVLKSTLSQTDLFSTK